MIYFLDDDLFLRINYNEDLFSVMDGYLYGLWIVVCDSYIISLCVSSEKGPHSRVNHFIPYPYNIYPVKKLKSTSKEVL